jgi:uncharacterized protein (DUF433 family)
MSGYDREELFGKLSSLKIGIMEPRTINHIESSPGVCGGKPCIVGTRIRVQDIYVWHELQGKTPDQIASDFPQLTLADVHAALAYYWDNRDEIEKQMKEAESLVASMKQKYASKLQEKLAGKDANGNPIPS